MSELTATRSALVTLAEDRRTMQEGYVFLDEKCLLLAGAMLRELRRFDAASGRLRALQSQAATALAAAIGHHGLQGLQCYPASSQEAIALHVQQRLLLNVPLLDASASREAAARPESAHATYAAYVSTEAEDCREAFLELRQQLAIMAAMSGNLARLYREYRRSVRRVRALQDVLLPELERDMNEIETQLEELERDEVLGARWRPTTTGVE